MTTQPAGTDQATGPTGLGPDHGYGPDIHHVLLTEQQIKDKIAALAADVARDYAGREVLLVSVQRCASTSRIECATASKRSRAVATLGSITRSKTKCRS